MNSFVITRELAALRRNELLAEAACERLARASRKHEREQGPSRSRLSVSPAPRTRLDGPAPCEADPELAPAATELVDRPTADKVGTCVP
jgi:hypothetical protein